MSETGATEAQIEAAVQRRLNETAWTDTAKEAYRRIWADEARHHASLLVPPGSRIFDAEDVAAVRRLVDEASKWSNLYQGFSADVQRIAAMVEGSR